MINNYIIQILVGIITSIGLFYLLIATLLKKQINQKEETDNKPKQRKKQSKAIFKTTGKHLNELFIYIVYFISFFIVILLTLFSFMMFNENISFGDIWPLLLVIGVMLFSSIFIIESIRTKSKRKTQRDMREI